MVPPPLPSSPHLESQHRMSSPSLSSTYDQYLTSPRTTPTIASLGSSSALSPRGGTSPVARETAGGTSSSDEDGMREGLHRRSSSRVRDARGEGNTGWEYVRQEEGEGDGRREMSPGWGGRGWRSGSPLATPTRRAFAEGVTFEEQQGRPLASRSDDFGTNSLERVDSLAPSFSSREESSEDDDEREGRRGLSYSSTARLNRPTTPLDDRINSTTTPSRSSSSSPQSHPKGSPVRRRNTLSAAAARGFRRMSVRVVNLAGAGEDTLLGPRGRSAARKDHRPIEDQVEAGGRADTGEEDAEEEDRSMMPAVDALRGNSLGVFGPRNRFRRLCSVILRSSITEPFILLLIVLSAVILTIQSTPSVYLYPRPTSPGYFHSWEDYALFAIFIAFTLEIIARVVVSGLLFTSAPIEEPTSAPMQTREKDSYSKSTSDSYPPQPLSEKDRRTLNTTQSTLRSNPSAFSLRPTASTPFVLSMRKQRNTAAQPFLRHSWNRVDLVAVLSFWICFTLATIGVEASGNWYIFRALSVLRCTRLLAVTAGTTTILQSLKKASPQLVKVALFLVFAMAMFSIIGVQSFEGSFRRSCLWIDPDGLLPNVSIANQHCGGFINSTSGLASGYIVNATGLPATTGSKGYLCPAPMVCTEGQNPNNGQMSFDNVPAALLQVVIVASANTWTTIMFNMQDSEYFLSALYFIACLVTLNFWLINLFVAVITNTFASIREQTSRSAFGSDSITHTIDPTTVPAPSRLRLNQSTTLVRRVYDRTRLVWVALALVSLAVQASRRFDMTPSQLSLLTSLELYFTIGFDVEILIRIFASLPNWRTLGSRRQDLADITLAVVTTIIQIPVIQASEAYPWLTIFQIARFYRVILAIPRMRRLLGRIVGTFAGLINMIVFMIGMNFLAALIASQLLRGVPQVAANETPEMTFHQIFNSFLAMYQILTSENWTDVLNNVMTSETGTIPTVIAALFLASWMLFAYFILINMFIALLSERFAIAEEEKHKQQLEAFVNRSEPATVRVSWFRRFNPYYFAKSRPKAVMVNGIPSSLVLPMDQGVVGDYSSKRRKKNKVAVKVPEGMQMDDLSPPMPSREMFSRDTIASESVTSERRALQSDFILAHPSYDKSLWIFSQRNTLRRFCQRFVDPASGGERIRGRLAVRRDKFAFQLVIFAAIVGSITVVAFATPVYMLEHGFDTFSWYTLVEIGICGIFIVEAGIKIIADGFLFSPNAYLLSLWNTLDFVILVTLIMNIVTTLVFGTSVSRFTRALKSLRALRLINLSETLRETFYNVLIVGAARILDASILAILYIIPFAVWGQNIFSGLLYFCNDTTVATKAECAGEYLNTAVSTWAYLAPRIWTNPYVWTFDSFRGALLILFEIISLEGWIAVMQSSMWITGKDLQPAQDASQFNSLFFVMYNLIGAVFILTLFVSVIIENFTRRSGTSLLTTEQRQWIDLRSLISRQRPAKRPKTRPASSYRSWCYDRAVQKHGWWSKCMTGLYMLQIIVLMTQATTNPSWANELRDYLFLFFSILFFVDIVVRITGLGWNSYRQNGWHLFDMLVVLGLFATTIPILFGSTNKFAVQLQKLFVVAISFKLVQTDSLHRLFKAARSSLPAIGNIFSLWLVLFLVWTIMYTQVFSLTRWGTYGTRNANYSSFPRAFIMLILASTGEGWNGFMHDYTVEFPLCTHSDNFLLSDCGSSAWAFALFITWNVLSMYLMSNLILGAVVYNFSFVFQIYGSVKDLEREQMREYKRVWGEFDPERTGYLARKDIVSFFSRLTGIFEVRVYSPAYSIKSLKFVVSPSHLNPFSAPTPASLHLDTSTLARVLHTMDMGEVKRRRKVYNRLYHEAMLDSEGEKGISFTSMLLLLAHYRLIDDEKALSLEEVIRRREKMERVNSRISSDYAQGRLRTLFLRRQFLATRQANRNEERGIPAIVVEEERGSTGLRIDTSGGIHQRTTSRTPPPLSPSLSPHSPYSPGNGGSSLEGRNSFGGEDGEEVVNQMLDRWGGGFVAHDD